MVPNLSTLESYFFDEFKRGRRMVELYELAQVRDPQPGRLNKPLARIGRGDRLYRRG